MALPARNPGRPTSDAILGSDVVLEAALKAFATYGYDGTSVRTLSRELGVSHNLLNQRFGSKDALWRAAVDWGDQRQRRAFIQADDTGRPPIERFRTFVHAYIRHAIDHPELFRLLYLEGGLRSERLEYLTQQYLAPARARFSEVLEGLARLGVIRPVPLAVVFSTLAFGATTVSTLRPMIEPVLPDHLYTKEWKDAYADDFTEFIMRALVV